MGQKWGRLVGENINFYNSAINTAGGKPTVYA